MHGSHPLNNHVLHNPLHNHIFTDHSVFTDPSPWPRKCNIKLCITCCWWNYNIITNQKVVKTEIRTPLIKCLSSPWFSTFGFETFWSASYWSVCVKNWKHTDITKWEHLIMSSIIEGDIFFGTPCTWTNNVAISSGISKYTYTTGNWLALICLQLTKCEGVWVNMV